MSAATDVAAILADRPDLVKKRSRQKRRAHPLPGAKKPSAAAAATKS